MHLPAVPRVGDEVVAHPNWSPLQVRGVEWRLDPHPGEPSVEVGLSDLDEDEYGDAAALLDVGWVVDPA